MFGGAACIDSMRIAMTRQNPTVCFQVDHVEDLVNGNSAICWGSSEELHGVLDLHGRRQPSSLMTLPLRGPPSFRQMLNQCVDDSLQCEHAARLGGCRRSLRGSYATPGSSRRVASIQVPLRDLLRVHPGDLSARHRRTRPIHVHQLWSPLGDSWFDASHVYIHRRARAVEGSARLSERRPIARHLPTRGVSKLPAKVEEHAQKG